MYLHYTSYKIIINEKGKNIEKKNYTIKKIYNQKTVKSIER